MKILALDIETAPALSYHWGMFNQNIGLVQMVKPPHMMCFAARWVDEAQTVFYSEHTHGREEMVQAAWKLLDEADVLMTYNGAKFDLPHLQREFLEMGLTPPAPVQQLDLYKTIKKQFAFISKKLDHVAQRLDVGAKVSHEGFGLWLACMDGDDDAWRRMETYNRQDVDLLIDLYAELRPWIPNHPSYAALAGDDICPSCGADGDVLKREGFALTGQGKFQRFRCDAGNGGCGRWFKATRAESMVHVREIAS